MRLSLRVELYTDESLPSFLSRLAELNGVRPTVFCSHLSIVAEGFVNGDADQVEKVAALAGVEAAELMRNAIIKAADGFELGGERLQRSSLHRDRLRICPCCLKADLDAGRSLHHRTAWHVAHLRSCAEHQVELHELAPEPIPSIVHDVAAKLGEVRSDLGEMSAAATPAPVSPFEDYIRSRLQGARGTNFLDSLELHAAARLCEQLGAAARFGIWRSLQTLDTQQWRAAADDGYAIAVAGEPGIRSFLSELQARRSQEGSGHDGPQAVFGALYDWLARASALPAFDQIRSIVRRHIVETMPFGAGDSVLGEVVERQLVHSVRTAHLETGLHPKRLTKILRAAEIVPDARGSDGMRRFDVDRGANLLAGLAGAMSLKDAGAYLGSDRVQTRLLHQSGMISSMTSTGGKLAFAKADLDRFLDDLTNQADTLPASDPNAASIPLAAKRSNCSAAEIVQLVLGHRLARLGLRNGRRRYDHVLVDFAEVRNLVRGAELEGLPRRWIIKEMKTTHLVVDALISFGVLQTRQEINPKNRCPVEIVPRTSFDEFRATFGTLFELAAEQGCHPRTLKSKLAAAGVRPAFEQEKFHATFYRRADVL